MLFQKRYIVLSLVCLVFLLSGCAAHKKLPPQARKKYTQQDRLAYQHFVNGDLYELDEQIDSAITQYQIALKYQPESPEIRTALAKAYFRRGEFGEALTQGIAMFGYFWEIAIAI